MTRMPTPRATPSPPPDIPGLAARGIAADILDGVLRRHRPLDEQLDGAGAPTGLAALADRDRALTRTLVATVLRRLGTLRHLLGFFLERGLPAAAPRVETLLLLGAAQILWLEVPDHAAVDLSVRLVRADRQGGRYAGLVNAVLRRLARDGKQRLHDLDAAALDTPDWLMQRWVRAYGADLARTIAIANAQEPVLDLTVKEDSAHWASLLGGRVLPTGSVRAAVHGPVTQLPGFAEGAWWVQDAAAALPARLLGDLRGKTVADLCAAPGGKTAQLAAAGARGRRRRPRRLRGSTGCGKISPALASRPRPSPPTRRNGRPGRSTPSCSTRPAPRPAPSAAIPTFPGSSRRPIIEKLAAVQRRLLAHAVELTKPGGLLGLLHLFAGTGRGRARSSTISLAAIRGCAAGRSWLPKSAGWRPR